MSRPFAFHLLYHIVSIGFMLLTIGFPDQNGGPCNAGLSILMYMPLIFADFVIVLINMRKLISKGRTHLPLFLLNLAAFVFLVILNFVPFR
jgi:hypothetical protein